MINWPAALDGALEVTFLVAAIGLPLLGWLLAGLDFRRYLRSLRRSLVRVSQFAGRVPHWARRHTPRSVAVFGLSWPCDEEQLKRAYREKVKHLHPDRGGDIERFRTLQRHFEEAIRLVRGQSA